MELVYLWVEKYKNIEKQGFNFSPRFECDFDGKNLTITEKDDYINIFPDNINITAIVGENGSGKSSIFEILFYKTKHHYFDTITFFIVQLNQKYYRYLFEGGALISKEEILIDTIIKINILDGYRDNNITKYDYLSFFLSNLNYEMPHIFIDDTETFIDISHSKLLRNKNRRSSILLHLIEMLEHTNIDLPIQIPTSLLINLTNITDIVYRHIEQKRFPYTFYNILIVEIAHRLGLNIKEKNTIEELIEIVENSFEEIKVFNGFPQEHRNPLLVINIQDELKKIKEALNIINSNKNNKIDILSFLSFDFGIRMSSGEENLLFQFANLYAEMINPKHKFKSYIENNSLHLLAYNVTLLIDEGETTLHPQWQKQYLSYLIYFLSRNFQNYNFHIVLTSHSPFLISDLPKENVIFLEKGKQVYLFDDNQQTFGANIHTLLSDGFFMSDGLMGEFAKGKINEIINFHKELIGFQENIEELKVYRCVYADKKKHFWHIQSIIGEEYLKQVVKNHLVEIEKIVLGEDKAKEAEIQRLQAQIDALKGNKC